VLEIRSVRTQVNDRLAKSSDAQLKAKGDAVVNKASAIEEDVYQVRNQSGQDPLNFPIKINNRLASLLGVVDRGDGRPIGNAPVIFKDLSGEVNVLAGRL